MQLEISEITPVLPTSGRASRVFADGVSLLLNRNVRPALQCFYSAQHLGYDIRECAAARWTCWMLLGRFECAWKESELITATGAKDPHQFWNGQSWDGKDVMLRCLHGLGDTIQFIRYAPLLRQTCRSLTAQTHPQLVRLIEGVLGVDRVFTWGPGSGAESFDWDVQMEVTELPRAFRTTISNIPAVTPYIQVSPERIRWASGLFRNHENLRIGISWDAGPWDPLRSIPLEEFSPLFECKNCCFYELQKGADPDRLRRCGAIYDLESYAANVQDTAALILNLDLVITVDTMTAHLAGALARPVWILLPARADWRWMLRRCDTPWYPTARLFRQKQLGDWRETIEEIRAALSVLQESSKGPHGAPGTAAHTKPLSSCR